MTDDLVNPPANKKIVVYNSTLVKRGLEIIPLLTPRRLCVPKDYQSISQAIENAQDWDIIEISSGIYKESLFVTKPIELIGVSPGEVILKHFNHSPDRYEIESQLITYEVPYGTSKCKNIIFQKPPEFEVDIGVKINSGNIEFQNCRFENYKHCQRYHIDEDSPCWHKAVESDDGRGQIIFNECVFKDCDEAIAGISVKMKECSIISSPISGVSIELNKCYLKSSEISMSDGATKYCIFSEGSSVLLDRGTNYMSYYDTFLTEGEEKVLNVYPDSKGTFVHTTVICKNLLDRYIGSMPINQEKDLILKDPGYTYYKDDKTIHVVEEKLLPNPILSFSDSIIYIKEGAFNKKEPLDFKQEMFQKLYFDKEPPASIADSVHPKDFSGEGFYSRLCRYLVNQGVLKFSGNNIVHIPPSFTDPDPLLIIQRNKARLSKNSPAINAASDGTNLGAWQGD